MNTLELFKQFSAKFKEDTFEIDDLIHDLKSDEASEINNSGLDEQFSYIVKTCGKDFVKDLVNEKGEQTLISDHQKENDTLFVANENIDQCGYVGTYEQWFHEIHGSDMGNLWYRDYLTDYYQRDHLSGEVPMSFTTWIEDLLESSLIEADENDIETKETL